VTQAPSEQRGQAAVRVRSLRSGCLYDRDETLAVEAPLEIGSLGFPVALYSRKIS
jgi:hypothetical protein